LSSARFGSSVPGSGCGILLVLFGKRGDLGTAGGRKYKYGDVFDLKK
jgi:hypothetical protein